MSNRLYDADHRTQQPPQCHHSTSQHIAQRHSTPPLAARAGLPGGDLRAGHGGGHLQDAVIDTGTTGLSGWSRFRGGGDRHRQRHHLRPRRGRVDPRRPPDVHGAKPTRHRQATINPPTLYTARKCAVPRLHRGGVPASLDASPSARCRCRAPSRRAASGSTGAWICRPSRPHLPRQPHRPLPWRPPASRPTRPPPCASYHAYPAHAPFGGYKKSGFGRETHKMMACRATTARPRTCSSRSTRTSWASSEARSTFTMQAQVRRRALCF